MHFICRSFLGHTEENSWSQYWENEPDDHQISSQKGHLFALINIVSDESHSVSDLGHRLIDDINHHYFTGDSSISTSLRSTLQQVIDSSQDELVDISLVVAIVHQSHLYVCQYNSGLGFLVRATNISRITSGQIGQITQISGKILPGDLLFFCTSNLYNNLTFSTIKDYLSQPDIQEIEESFLSTLYTLPQQPTLAGLLIGLNDDQDNQATLVEGHNPIPPSDSKTQDIVPPPAETEPTPTPPPSPSVYISKLDTVQVKKRRRLNIVFSILLLSALGVSIFMGSKRNQVAKTESEYQSLKSQYLAKIDNARTVKNINLAESQTLAKSAKEIVVKLDDLKVHPEEVKQFFASVDQILSQTGSADTYQPQSFYDSTLVNSSAEFSKMLTSKNTLYLLDSKNGYLDKLDLSSRKKDKIIYGDTLKNVSGIAENNGHIYLLINNKISSVDNASLSPVSDLSDSIKGLESDQISMWNGSLYLMGRSPEANGIWKLTPSGNGFGAPQMWLKKPADFPSNASSFAINGQVWVITKSGSIVPYNRGDKGEFKSQIVSSLTQAGNLVTAIDSEILSFTEKDNLVYVYHKDGSVASSYNFGTRKVLSLAIDTSANRLLILCNDKQIYQIGL
jgi:hypothetical protein